MAGFLLQRSRLTSGLGAVPATVPPGGGGSTVWSGLSPSLPHGVAPEGAMAPRSPPPVPIDPAIAVGGSGRTGSYRDRDAGEEAVATFYTIAIDPDIPAGHEPLMRLSISDSLGNLWLDSFSLTVHR